MRTGTKILSNYMANQQRNPLAGVKARDFRVLGNNSATMLVSSHRELSKAELSAFVTQVTEGRLTPVMATARGGKHPASTNAYYSIVVARAPEIRIEATEPVVAKMAALTANTYLDAEYNQVWSKKDVGGVPVFARDNTEELDKVMRSAMMSASAASQSADPITLDDTTIRPNENDAAEVFVMDEEGNTGITIARVIRACGNDEYEVELGTEVPGETAKVSAHAIVNHYPVNAGMDGEIVDYLGRAYGDEYVQYLKQMGDL